MSPWLGILAFQMEGGEIYLVVGGRAELCGELLYPLTRPQGKLTCVGLWEVISAPVHSNGNLQSASSFIYPHPTPRP